MKGLGRRVVRIEERECVREADLGPAHLTVMPDDWPKEDRRAYNAHCDGGEFAARADLLAKHTDQRPGPRTRVVAFRLRADGPQ